jgi:hypothetical protein
MNSLHEWGTIPPVNSTRRKIHRCGTQLDQRGKRLALIAWLYPVEEHLLICERCRVRPKASDAMVAAMKQASRDQREGDADQ